MYQDTTRRHCVRWGPSSPSPKGAQPPVFDQCRCGQTVGWTKMPLGTVVGLRPGDFVFDGDGATPEKRHSPHPIFGPCLLWPSGWVDQDATWYGCRPRPRRLCSMGSQLPPKGAQTPVFCPCLLWPNGGMNEDATWYESRPRPRPHCVRRGPSSPAKGAQQPPLFSPFLLWPRSPISATADLLQYVVIIHVNLG